MSAAKNQIKQLLSEMPDDASFEEIVREIAFAKMIHNGLEDSRQNRVISNEEMEHRIRSWQG